MGFGKIKRSEKSLAPGNDLLSWIVSFTKWRVNQMEKSTFTPMGQWSSQHLEGWATNVIEHFSEQQVRFSARERRAMLMSWDTYQRELECVSLGQCSCL